MLKDMVDVFSWCEEKWHSDYAPFFIFPIVFLVVLYTKSLLPDFGLPLTTWIILAVILGVLAVGLWIFQHKIPKVPEGYIGLVIAISPVEDDSRAKIVKDFVDSLKSILQQIQYQQTPFYVLELSKYHVKKITNDFEAKIFCEKCNSRFLVYGTSRVRKIKGKDHHAVKLRGLVSHSPISFENSSALAQEMNNVLPLDFKISCENDLLEFETVSLCFSESAKFIIATAAMLSNDLALALNLLTQLNNSKKQVEKHKKNVPVVAQLLTLIPLRLANLHDHLSNIHFNNWRQSKNEVELNLAKENRDASHKLVPDNLRYSLINAIWHFVIKKDVQNALRVLNQCFSKYIQVPVLRYNLAFLYAYSGDMKKALSEYEAAFILDSSFETAFEVEEFIAWILSLEPNKYQLWYCLGLINHRIKNDNNSALLELKKFIESDSNNSFPETKKCATQLIQELELEPEPETDFG